MDEVTLEKLRCVFTHGDGGPAQGGLEKETLDVDPPRLVDTDTPPGPFGGVGGFGEARRHRESGNESGVREGSFSNSCPPSCVENE